MFYRYSDNPYNSGIPIGIDPKRNPETANQYPLYRFFPLIFIFSVFTPFRNYWLWSACQELDRCQRKFRRIQSTNQSCSRARICRFYNSSLIICLDILMTSFLWVTFMSHSWNLWFVYESFTHCLYNRFTLKRTLQ